MKFLILTQFFPPEMGAPQTRLGELTDQLQRHNHQVEVLTAMPNYPTGRIFSAYKNKFYVKDKYKNATIHRFWLHASKGKSYRRLLTYFTFMCTCLCGLFVCQKPDYIFVNSGPLFLSIPGRILSLIWRRPVIFNVADLWPRSVQKLEATGSSFFIKPALYLEAASYKNALYVTAVTEGIREILLNEKKIAEKKLLFLPNGVNTALYKPAPELEKTSRIRHQLDLETKFIFIYPGNHGFAHALHNVLAAAQLIQNESAQKPELQKIHVLFLGDGSEKERLLKIKEEHQLRNVSFRNPVSQEDLVEYLQVSNVGLINIRNTHLANETRPAKMFPIMSMQKPILFAGHGEGANIIKNCGGGVVVPAESPESLKTAMIEIFENKFDLGQMGLNNRQYILQNLEFGQIVKTWLDELQSREKPV